MFKNTTVVETEHWDTLKQYAAQQHFELERLVNYTDTLLRTIRHLTYTYDGSIPVEIQRAKVLIQTSPLTLYQDEYVNLIRDHVTQRKTNTQPIVTTSENLKNHQ